MQTADLHVNKVNIVVKCSTRFPFHKPNHLEDCSILEQCLHRLPASWQVWSLHFCRTLMSLWDPPILNLLVCKYHHQILEWTLNNALYLSVNVLSLKLIIFWGPFFYISYWTKARHFTWSSEPCKGLAVCKAMVVPSMFSHFKTVSIDQTHNLPLCNYVLYQLSCTTAENSEQFFWVTLTK